MISPTYKKCAFVSLRITLLAALRAPTQRLIWRFFSLSEGPTHVLSDDHSEHLGPRSSSALLSPTASQHSYPTPFAWPSNSQCPSATQCCHLSMGGLWQWLQQSLPKGTLSLISNLTQARDPSLCEPPIMQFPPFILLTCADLLPVLIEWDKLFTCLDALVKHMCLEHNIEASTPG